MSILEPGDKVRSVLMGDIWILVRRMNTRESFWVCNRLTVVVNSLDRSTTHGLTCIEQERNLIDPNKYTLIKQPAKSRLELIES